jgi:sphingomyelin phosphodiesterase acid-like 3
MGCKRKGFKSFGLIFPLVLLLQLGACSSGSGTNSTNTSFRVVVFTDVHFDPLYDTSLFWQLNASDPSQWAAIFQTSKVTAPSAWGDDTNYPLLVLTLSGIEANLSTSPLVIFTGDPLGHYLPKKFFGAYDPEQADNPTPEDIGAMKAFTDKTVAFFIQQVKSAVGNTPVMFALGNADSYWGLGPDSGYLSDTAELYYSFVNSTVDHKTFITTFMGGGYYSAEPPGTNLMVIGLNTFEFSPFFGDTTYNDVMAQLNWFDLALGSAQSRGKTVWLLMHVPPGADKYSTAQAADPSGHITTATMMWNQNYQDLFLQKLAKYPGLIAQTFTAHTHMDEYRIMSPSDVAVTTPGIAPYFGNNPAFKVFTFSSDTLTATDCTSFNYDLGTLPGLFNSYYTFSTAYSMVGSLGDSLALLYPQLATDSAKQSFYRGSYFSGHNYSVPIDGWFQQITDQTWPVYWCGIMHMDKQGLIDCVNAY